MSEYYPTLNFSRTYGLFCSKRRIILHGKKTNRRNERAENRHTKSQDENALLEVEAEIEQTLEEKMDAMTEKLQQNQNADGTNSYYKLGGYARDIYLQYQKDWSGYRKNLTVEYYWDVTLVTSP